MMNKKVCVSFNSCSKIDMICDKDMMPWQYAKAIEKVCGGCNSKDKDIRGSRPDNWQNPYRNAIEDIKEERMVWTFRRPLTIIDVLEREARAFESGADAILDEEDRG